MAGWIYPINIYLSQPEMENNALVVQAYLQPRGWTNNAIAGLLGNMQSESTINPAIWESLNEWNYSGGYGLVQWTPASKYIDWANANGYSITDGDAQLFWIDANSEASGQWIKTDAYPLTFTEFKKSTQSPSYLASAFLKNFERAGVEVESQRRAQAEAWYTFINGSGGSDDVWLPKKRKGYKFVLFNNRSKRNVKQR